MIRNHEWYAGNAVRAYPLSDAATTVDDAGQFLPHDILVDCQLAFPNTLGQAAFVGAVAVSARLITVLIQAADTPAAANNLLLASITLLRADIKPWKPYPLVSDVPGVGGWIVFGTGPESEYQGRFSSPTQSLLLPRCARAYPLLPVSSVGKPHIVPALTGIIAIKGGQDVETLIADRVIEGELRRALVIRLLDKLDRNVLSQYVGPCGARPESGNCPQSPIEQIGTVAPDCSGNIDIVFEHVQLFDIQGGGIGVAHPLGLTDVCQGTDALPATDGTLPNEYEDLCNPTIESSVVESSDSDGSDTLDGSSDTVSSESVVGFGLPHIENFDQPDLHAFWLPIVGQYTFIADDSPGEVGGGGESDWSSAYSSYALSSSSLQSSSLVDFEEHGLRYDAQHSGYVLVRPTNRSLVLSDVTRRNVVLWADPGYTDTSRLYCRTHVKLVAGVECNGGIVVNYHPRGVPPRNQYYWVGINRKTDALEIRFFNGSRLSGALVSAAPLGVSADAWYELIVRTQPATSGGVLLVASVRGISDPSFPEASISLTTSTYLPADGRFGLGTYKAKSLFSFFELREAA